MVPGMRRVAAARPLPQLQRSAWRHHRAGGAGSRAPGCTISDDGGTEHQRRPEALDECARRPVVALIGEDRGKHGHAEHAADLADRIGGT
jgi:hypothetical protein